MALPMIRVLLYVFLFMISAALLGLTAHRVHVTESLASFSESIIVELLVASCLGVIFSLYFLFAILRRLTGAPHSYAAEQTALWILWILFVVGAAIHTSRFGYLRFCRSISRECRILEAIKALAWIAWIWTTFLLISSYTSMSHRTGRKFGAPLHGRDLDNGYPRDRSAAHNRKLTETTQASNAPIV